MANERTSSEPPLRAVPATCAWCPGDVATFEQDLETGEDVALCSDCLAAVLRAYLNARRERQNASSRPQPADLGGECGECGKPRGAGLGGWRWHEGAPICPGCQS